MKSFFPYKRSYRGVYGKRLAGCDLSGQTPVLTPKEFKVSGSGLLNLCQKIANSGSSSNNGSGSTQVVSASQSNLGGSQNRVFEWHYQWRKLRGEPLKISLSSSDMTMYHRMRYPGGKFRCYQKLISLMPEHRVYIETHLGGGAVLRNKAPAEENIGIDLDERVIASFTEFPTSYRFVIADSVTWLTQARLKGDELVYSDPPYPPESRRALRCYRHDYTTADHVRLLSVLKGLPCKVMISSYPNDLYERELTDWHLTSFGGTSHVGARTEYVWTNFKPGLLHDTRYLGWTFRGRQSWQRKQDRWMRRFSALPVAEQQAMLLSLQAKFSESASQFQSCRNENHRL